MINTTIGYIIHLKNILKTTTFTSFLYKVGRNNTNYKVYPENLPTSYDIDITKAERTESKCMICIIIRSVTNVGYSTVGI